MTSLMMAPMPLKTLNLGSETSKDHAKDSPLSSITPSIHCHEMLTRVGHASTLTLYPEGQLRISTMDYSINTFLCEEYEANDDGKATRPPVEHRESGTSQLLKTSVSAYGTQ